jgi:hypothetical protein
MTDKTVAVPQPIFIKKVHELSKLHKKLESVSNDVIDVIVETMNSKDTDPKLKVACATTLADMHIKVSDIISKDQLTRQIAEIKANGLKTPLKLENVPVKPSGPRRDFFTIQSVGNVDE